LKLEDKSRCGEGRSQNSKREIRGSVDLSHSFLLPSSFTPFFPQAMSKPELLTSAGSCEGMVGLCSGEGQTRTAA